MLNGLLIQYDEERADRKSHENPENDNSIFSFYAMYMMKKFHYCTIDRKYVDDGMYKNRKCKMGTTAQAKDADVYNKKTHIHNAYI